MAPVTEMNDVAEGSAPVRAVGGLDRGQPSEFGDLVACLDEGGAIGTLNLVSHSGPPLRNTHHATHCTGAAYQNAATLCSTPRPPTPAGGTNMRGHGDRDGASPEHRPKPPH